MSSGYPTLTASADFCQPIPSLCSDGSTWQVDRSPRVRRATFIPYTRRIYFYIFRVIIGLWILWPPRPDVAASYAVAVRRAGTLPTASFRFRLTTDTLAVQLTVPITRACRGLSPPSYLVKYHIQPRCINPLHAMPGIPQKNREEDISSLLRCCFFSLSFWRSRWQAERYFLLYSSMPS